MTQPSQTDSSAIAPSTNEPPAFASAASGALLPAQQDTSVERAPLLNNFNQIEGGLVMPRKPIARTLATGSADVPKQSYGWERKLTRAQWRPT